MISARQPIDRLESNISWQAFEQQHDHNRTVQMIDTKNLSAQLEPRVVAECPDHAWAHRLFLIYQTVFEDVLKRFPQESDFVFLEDDALLVDASVFEFEVCRAQVEEHAFFSLYRASRQDSCIYHSGTVAFYITKPVMEEVIRVGTATSCRLPIDIFLATNGPWYATAEDIVRHHSVRTKLIDG
ncbi:TPA: hypothetical protein N0F65_003413 [Lagenidium giganteum]|uniref:Uncharacterized protein n=1 Tax=Lagenidium giganteum TaxID=4803 RepID=A0AAV2YMC2_9STRA|nr:TPA: hypothetical protein N0F65_003413 [Lagenidium giganteum]